MKISPSTEKSDKQTNGDVRVVNGYGSGDLSFENLTLQTVKTIISQKKQATEERVLSRLRNHKNHFEERDIKDSLSRLVAAGKLIEAFGRNKERAFRVPYGSTSNQSNATVKSVAKYCDTVALKSREDLIHAVVEAIDSAELGKNGVNLQDIEQYILRRYTLNYKSGSNGETDLNVLLRDALVAACSDGRLQKVKNKFFKSRPPSGPNEVEKKILSEEINASNRDGSDHVDKQAMSSPSGQSKSENCAFCNSANRNADNVKEGLLTCTACGNKGSLCIIEYCNFK